MFYSNNTIFWSSTITIWNARKSAVTQYESLECKFQNFKNDIQPHEIRFLKFVVYLDPSVNDFIGSRPEM